MPSVTAFLNVPSFHFVVVSRIEQRDGPPFVEPALQFSRGKFRRRSLAGFDPRNAKRDDLLLDAHQHAVERLLVADADFGREVLEARNRRNSSSSASISRRPPATNTLIPSGLRRIVPRRPQALHVRAAARTPAGR